MSQFQRLRSLLSILNPPVYPWPALDIILLGERHLHLVGSIHMGTREMVPLPARLISRLRTADALIVEADITDSISPFDSAEIALSIEQRLDPTAYQHVQTLCNKLRISLASINHQPAWQIALTLQAHQAYQLGLQPQYGIDYQLLEMAKKYAIPVMELEGAQYQNALLLNLAEEGIPLLNDTLTYWHTNARMLQIMIGWWLESPPTGNNKIFPNTFGDELYDILMYQRNHKWLAFLKKLPAGHYVVAVGALHLYGEGNLPTLLRKE